MTIFAASGMGSARPGHPRDRAGWLGLAAAPTFASMAWLSAVGAHGMEVCLSPASFAPINDMSLMYLLMGLFHLSPWLQLVSARSWRLDIPTTQTEGD